ncbi:MAG: retropepsin-like aspartic protease [Blastocatellia bacterium]
MPTYNNSLFLPPAPVAEITLRHSISGAALPDVLMLIDSGADVTLLPRPFVRLLEIAVIPDVRYPLAGFDGHVADYEAVRADVIFQGQTFRGQYLVIDEDWGLLGRDILNHLRLVLDGPALSWEAGAT